MSISLGSTNFGSLYLGSTKIGAAYLGSVKVYGSTPPDPYNPLNLPPYTIRLKYTSGVTPNFNYGTAVQVSSSPNVWDLTYNSSDWRGILYSHQDLIEILGANTTGVSLFTAPFVGCINLQSVSLFDTSSATNMDSMFHSCSSLTSIPLFDTSSVTNMHAMFNYCSSLTSVPTFNTSLVTITSSMFESCSSLTSIPLLDTSSVTDMSSMLSGCSALTSIPLFDTSSVNDMRYMCMYCTAVETGALALYQQASTQSNPPTQFSLCFTNCGKDTVTGAAELAQIPASWGGTKS